MAFKIWNDSNVGWRTKIEIDGERVETSIRDLTIRAHCKGVVSIALDPAVYEVPVNDEGSVVTLRFGAPETRELLIKHGWTPPVDDDHLVWPEGDRES